MGDAQANLQFRLSCVAHLRKLLLLTKPLERRARPFRQCHGRTLVAALGTEYSVGVGVQETGCGIGPSPWTILRTPCWGLQGGQESRIFASMTLRHTFAIRRMRGGANLVAVSGQLRHASTRMSERYLRVTRADLRAAVEAGQPIATGVLTGTEVEVLLQVVNLPSGAGNGQAAVHPAEGGTRALPGEPRGNQENSPWGLVLTGFLVLGPADPIVMTRNPETRSAEAG